MPTCEAATSWLSVLEPPVQWEPRDARSEDVELKAEINRAKEILKLTYDWDGECSAPYASDTLERTFAFLRTHSAKGYELCSFFPPAPKITPGPDGSIDIHWKQKNWELLVNVPADSSESAVFYGDDYGVSKIKGTFDPKTLNLGIVNWLMH